MDLGLKGKVALVVAASRGLGKAVAWEFAREGAHVTILRSEGRRAPRYGPRNRCGHRGRGIPHHEKPKPVPEVKAAM
jgi:3-oxoacyl-[acyl-carrier protein] reductase